MPLMPPIRPTVRAVIRQNNLVLAQVKSRASLPRYLTLPGGRQEMGETMQECLVREVFEEVGAEIVVGDILHVADVFRSRSDGMRHQTEVLFSCALQGAYVPKMGPHPDGRQVATAWIDLAREGELFRPRYDLALLRHERSVYLGALRDEIT